MFEHIPFPSIFVCFIIFIVWLHYKKNKATKETKRQSKEFWQMEEAANHARNKDISQLPYFKPDINDIPMLKLEDANCQFYQEQIRTCMKSPMIDLSDYTNTELKLAYGVGNFKTLSDYDENFNSFLMNLSNLAKSYCDMELWEEASLTYQLCIRYGSDKSTDYLALGNIYAHTNSRSKLETLIEGVAHSDLPRRDALILKLKELM